MKRRLMRRWGSGWPASLALLALAWLPLWPMFTGDWFPFQHDFAMADLLHLHLPYRAYMHERMMAGELPLWWPEVLSGTPFWAALEPGVLWLPNLIALPLPPQVALDAVWLMNTAIAAASGWLYARGLGARPLVATLAGLAWALSGGMVSHLKHPNFHAAVAVMPLVFTALERGIRGRGFAALAWSVALSLSAGMPQITWITLLGCALRALVWGSGELVRRTRRRAAIAWRGVGAVLGVALGFGLAAVILLPAWHLATASARHGGLSYADAHRWSNPVWEYVSLLIPLGRPPYESLQSLGWESWFYQGVVVSLGALWGVRVAPRERRWAWTALLVGAFALGLPGPLSRVAWGLVPGMNLFRFHQRFLLLAAFAVLSFAICGLDDLVGRLAQRWRVLVPLALTLVSLGDLAYHHRLHLRWARWEPWMQLADAGRVVPEGGRTRFAYIDEYERMFRLAMDGDAADPRTFRDVAGLPLGSLGALHHRFDAGGYANLADARVAAYFKRMTPAQTRESFAPTQWAEGMVTPEWRAVLDRAAVAYVLTHHDTVDDAELHCQGLERVFDDGRERVLRNRRAVPRAYVARRWHAVSSSREAGEYILGPGREDDRVPTIEGVSADGSGVEEIVPVSVRDVSPEELLVDLRGAPAGWLIVSDSYSEGWTATVDGRSVPIAYANGYQRAVRIPGGARRATFVYEAPGFRAGLFISFISLLISFLISFLSLFGRGRQLPHKLPASS